jgi:modulator of FtsH protease HflC
MNRMVVAVVVGLVVLVAALSSCFIVHQTEQVLVTRFGQPVRIVRDPGLTVKWPWESVISMDRRLLDFEGPREEVILGDQRRLVVDSFARFHIVDPLLYFQTTGGLEVGIRGRLNSIITSAVRRVLGNEPLPSVLSNDRARIMGEIRRQVNDEAKRFGIDMQDVRIRRADLPEQNTQAILSRMQSERERVARQERAEGAQESVGIRSQAERERTVIIAEAQRDAEILRGQGDREAIGIFARAYSKDPDFFQVWRTLQAYREAFADGESRLVLTPDSDFFRYFRTMPSAAGHEAAAPASDTPATASGAPAR